MEHRSVTFQAGCSLSLPASTVDPRSSTKQIEKKSEKKLKINFLKKIQTAPIHCMAFLPATPIR